MADNRKFMKDMYKVELTYVNTKDGINTKIRTECIESFLIDYQFDNNSEIHMPMIYFSTHLDKSLADHIIRNNDVNYFIMILYKLNELEDEPTEIECFKGEFAYYVQLG